MASNDWGTRIGTTKYKCVSECRNFKGATFFKAQKLINGKMYSYSNSDLKKCALQLDKKLIESGKEPVNILKRK